MRDFSKINPSIWASKRFTSLDDDGKLFYLYALTSPQSNSCGCYRLPIGYIMEDLGWEKDRIRYGIDRVSDTKLIEYDFDEHVIMVSRWYEYNPPSNPKHCLKVISELACLPNCELKSRNAKDLYGFINTKTWDTKNVLEHLKPLLNDRVYDTVSDRVSRLGDTETKTETETETDSPLIPLKEGDDKNPIKNERENYDRLQPRTRRNKKRSYTDSLFDAASAACEKVRVEEERGNRQNVQTLDNSETKAIEKRT